jgi:hypothetical protein
MVLVAAVAMPLAAGGTQEESDLESELVEALQDEGLTEDEARAVAEAAAELEEEGYTRSEVAVATLEAVDELHGQIQAWKDGELDSETLGSVVRNTASDAATEAAGEAGDPEEGTGGDRSYEAGEHTPDAASDRARSGGDR